MSRGTGSTGWKSAKWGDAGFREEASRNDRQPILPRSYVWGDRGGNLGDGLGCGSGTRRHTAPPLTRKRRYRRIPTGMRSKELEDAGSFFRVCYFRDFTSSVGRKRNADQTSSMAICETGRHPVASMAAHTSSRLRSLSMPEVFFG